MNKYIFLIIGLLSLNACNFEKPVQPLPILGIHDIDKEAGDTTYHSIPDFEFTNQDSTSVTNATFEGKIYIADFFFTSCPTICIKTAEQMLRIHERFKTDDRVVLLAHSIDTKRDTVGRLKEYAEKLGVSTPKWHFVTGDKDKIYDIAEDYMSIAKDDPTAPGGFDHSGWLILIDKNRHIRSFCNGTKEEAVTTFMKDIDWLLENMD